MTNMKPKQLGRIRRITAFFILIGLLILIFLLIHNCTYLTKSNRESNAINQFMISTDEALLSAQHYELDVVPILQNPELPTGCEITSLTMALNYCGYEVDKLTMADSYLICSEPYQATFGEAFIGSPYDKNAWGCYAPVIVKTAENFVRKQNGGETVKNLTGYSVDALFKEVANNTPVITWVTIGMTTDVEERYYWTTPDGKDAVFLRNEHCVLLCGYDFKENMVTVCDPLEGMVHYDMDTFKKCYEIMYRQAVVITHNSTKSNENH